MALIKSIAGNEVCDQTARNSINGLDIGGTNLARYTNQGAYQWGWSMQVGDVSYSEVTENGIRCVKMTRGSTAQSGWSVIEYHNIGRDKWEANTTYTVSMECKSSVGNLGFSLSILEGNGTNPLNQSVTSINNVIKTANTWTKLAWIVKSVSSLPSSTSQYVYLTGMNSGTGVWYQFRNLKIEKGNKPTAWCPSPEDYTVKMTDDGAGNVTIKTL